MPHVWAANGLRSAGLLAHHPLVDDSQIRCHGNEVVAWGHKTPGPQRAAAAGRLRDVVLWMSSRAGYDPLRRLILFDGHDVAAGAVAIERSGADWVPVMSSCSKDIDGTSALVDRES